jgi:predicted permease
MAFWDFLHRGGRRGNQLDDEVAFHLKRAIQDRIERGENPREAIRSAHREFGNVTLVKEVTREMWGWTSIETLIRDASFALRVLKRQPGFTLISILTLTIGIGSATAAFSILDPWLIRPLPLKDAQRLCAVWRTAAADPSQPAYFFGFRDYLGFANAAQSFTQIAGCFHRNFAMTGTGKPEDVTGEVATGTLFATLETQAAMGRTFLPDDLTGEKVAVISHAFWERRLGASASAIGQTLTLNEEPYRIIGVLPTEFSYRVLNVPYDADVWTPIRQDDPMYTPTSDSAVGIVGRLKDGVSQGQARAELAGIQERMDHERSPMPEIFVGAGTLVATLQEDNARLIKSSLLVLAAAVACVLLIACANTTALMLGRNATRDAEFAIRAALGSGVRRLLQQLLTESLALYLCGALGGMVLAWATVRGFVAWNPLAILPPGGITLSLRTLAVAGAITCLASICFGALPAFYGSRVNLSNALRGSGHNATLGRGRIRAQSVIVAAQIAIALALVAGTGVLVSTLLRLQHQDFGFDPARAGTFQLSLPNSRYAKPDQFVQFQERLLARLRELPGVTAAASGPRVDYGDASQTPFAIGQQRAVEAREMPHAVVSAVSSQFFRALRIPIVQGEDFRDNTSPTDEPVAVIDETVARLYFQGTDPVGQYIRIGDPTDKDTAQSPSYRVIGVGGDTKSLAYNQLVWKTRPEVYVDFRQQSSASNSGPWGARNVSYVVSMVTGSAPSLEDLQTAVWSLDPELPLKAPETLSASISRHLAAPRTRAQALLLLAGISLLLAAIGVYGVLAQTVTARHPEIAVRLALGADRRNILRLVLGRALTVALTGIIAGTLLVVGASRAMTSVAYGVSALNPWLYGGAAVLLLAVALLAAYIPARRAASLDPVSALRAE